MENKAHALAAGLFVLFVSALLIALAAWLTRDTGVRRVYEISSPEAVNGLQPQAAVRYRGVAVGKVTAIGFDPKTLGNILVRIAVDDSAPVTQSTFATLGFQGVTGLAFVQLDDTGVSRTALASTDGEPARIPMHPSLLSKLSDQGVAILTQLEQTSQRVNLLLSPDNQKQLMATVAGIGQAAASVQQLSVKAQQLSGAFETVLNAQLGPERVNIPLFVAEATGTFKALQRTSGGIDQTALEFKKTAAELTRVAERLNAQDGVIDRLADGAAAMTAAGQSFNAATLPRLNRTSEEAARTARQVSRTVSAVSDNPQSLIFGNGFMPPGPGEPGFFFPKGAQ
jgi:phospholipid/cholesterol/gamma-HCH transport system substrate-binding protein